MQRDSVESRVVYCQHPGWVFDVAKSTATLGIGPVCHSSGNIAKWFSYSDNFGALHTREFEHDRFADSSSRRADLFWIVVDSILFVPAVVAAWRTESLSFADNHGERIDVVSLNLEKFVRDF